MPTQFTLGNQKASIPASYSEMTLGQFTALTQLQDPNDYSAVLEILSGIKSKLWNDAELNSVNIAALNASLAWLSTKVDWSAYPVVDKVTLGEKEIQVPKKIELKTLGQKMAFDRFVTHNIQANGEDSGTLPAQLLTDAIAIYLQPEYTGEKFNSDKLGQVKELVDKLPVTTAVPLAAFFLKKLIGLRNVKLKSNTPKTMIRKQQELNHSQASAT